MEKILKFMINVKKNLVIVVEIANTLHLYLAWFVCNIGLKSRKDFMDTLYNERKQHCYLYYIFNSNV